MAIGMELENDNFDSEDGDGDGIGDISRKGVLVSE